MHETENQVNADIDELYRLLEKISESSLEIKARLTRQGVRLNQIEDGVRGIKQMQERQAIILDSVAEIQVIHGERLAAIIDLLHRR
jgi:hypothetical protein